MEEKTIMKETNIVVSVIVGAEIEQVTARDARTGKLLYAGTRDGFYSWFSEFTEPTSVDVSSEK